MTARAVMVCGTTSGAGKSFLVTALARWYARQGLKVAPFKAQNMSNNARVVADGEIGSAQYFQALAAGAIPDVRMNPVLLKPEGDMRSQVIVLGRRRDELASMEWRTRADHLWPVVQSSLAGLLRSHDVVVIEGAGSPAEINLAATDIVNMRVAEAAGAATLIVCDIDRGGAFAHLYGTFELLAPRHRALVRGFVLNKFRGDATLLAPGPDMLQTLTGVPTVAVLPMWRDHGLPEEDGLVDWRLSARAAGSRAARSLEVAIVAYPQLSNLDEFTSLLRVPGLHVSWVRDARAVAAADLLVLPGSKHVAADLRWLRDRGIVDAIKAHVAADGPTLALCGGLQMLGREVRDPHGVEGAAAALDVLPYTTELLPAKRYRRGSYALSGVAGFWAPLEGIEFAGYEIRHGHTAPLRAPAPRPLIETLAGGCGFQSGQTLALYVHGMFENPRVMRALFGHATPTLEDTFDDLADFVDEHFGAGVLAALAAAPFSAAEPPAGT